MKLMDQPPQLRAIAKHRGVMSASSVPFLGVEPLRVSQHPPPPTHMSPKERISAAFGAAQSMLMCQLAFGNGTGSPQVGDARKMTACMMQHHASQRAKQEFAKSVSVGVRRRGESAKLLSVVARTVQRIERAQQTDAVSLNDMKTMMFPISDDESHHYSDYPLGYGMNGRGPVDKSLRKFVFQKLCDTIMPIDVLAAVAKRLEYVIDDKAQRAAAP